MKIRTREDKISDKKAKEKKNIQSNILKKKNDGKQYLIGKKQKPISKII